MVDHVMMHGLILALPACDPLIGGARDQELADNVLPCGSKRKRQTITRYYLDANPRSILAEPHLSQDEIVCPVLAENGLCTAWASWSWRDGLLYVASSKPVVEKSHLDTLFGVARAIFQSERPVSRLGSHTVVVGLRASGPSGMSVAAVRQADSVRRLNAILTAQLADRGWTSIALVRHKEIAEHIDSLDEDLAFMISRAWESPRDTRCRLHLVDPLAALSTHDLWQSFNPLRPHSVTADV
eukprot:2324278-Amphidinium_carterae.1